MDTITLRPETARLMGLPDTYPYRDRDSTPDYGTDPTLTPYPDPELVGTGNGCPPPRDPEVSEFLFWGHALFVLLTVLYGIAMAIQEEYVTAFWTGFALWLWLGVLEVCGD